MFGPEGKEAWGRGRPSRPQGVEAPFPSPNQRLTYRKGVRASALPLKSFVPFLEHGHIHCNSGTGTFQEQSYGIHDDSGNHFAVQTSVKQKAIMVITNPTRTKSLRVPPFKRLISNGFQWHPPTPSAGCRCSAVSRQRCCAAGAAGPTQYCSCCFCKSPLRNTFGSYVC